MTYGSAAEARTEDEQPDLILVRGDSGLRGYVHKSDLDDVPEPKSPEEALSWQRSKKYSADRVLVVYQADGTTKIDTFTIDGDPDSITGP